MAHYLRYLQIQLFSSLVLKELITFFTRLSKVNKTTVGYRNYTMRKTEDGGVNLFADNEDSDQPI